MKNQVIKVLDRDHGRKVIEYWKSQGVNTCRYVGLNTVADEEVYGLFTYYGMINNRFGNYSLSMVQNYNAEIIELPEEKTFPRKMLVWDDDEKNAAERIVLWENTFGNPVNKYVAVHNHYENDFEKGKIYPTRGWQHAKEIPAKPEPVKLTVAEICKKLGYDVEIVK